MACRPLNRPHRGRGIALALLLVAVCLCSVRAAQGQALQEEEVGALVNRCIDAYGGADRLRAMDGWQQIGKLASATRGVALMARVFSPPERLRVEIRFSDESSEIRILNGEQGWRSGQPVQGPLYAAMVLQAARLSLPLILLEGKAQIRDLGGGEASGRNVRWLGLELRDDMRLEVEIDETTARIVRSRSIAGPLVFETAYEDFRQVEGVVFPFVEKSWAMGQETGRFEIEQISLDGEIGDQVFRP